MKSRSGEIGSLNYPIAKKFDRHISSKFQSDWSILNTNFATSGLCEILQQDALSDIEMGPCSMANPLITFCSMITTNAGPCITNVFATRRKNFSQWYRSFQRKLLSHWLKFLRHVAITLVIQGPGYRSNSQKTPHILHLRVNYGGLLVGILEKMNFLN